MIDKFGRDITYMRLSVTDKCNLRCRYCMPVEGVCLKEHREMLTEDEMITAVEAAASLGVKKLRITGGEPLVKRNIVSICRRAAAVEGIREVCLTTNGLMLPKLAKDLKDAGVKRINLSLDTLDPEKYAYITRIGTLDDFMAGLNAALDAGFEKIKINAVLIGGFNDNEIVPLAELTRQYPVDMRFIEMMPMYDSGDFQEASFVPNTRVLEALPGIRKAVLLIGGHVLMLMGFKLVRAKVAERGEENSAKSSLWKSAVAAFVVSWMNPQAIIDATILLGAARASVPPGTDWVFMGGMAMASCLWFTSLTLIVSLLGDRFTPRVLRWLNVVCGVCLFIYGVSLCLTAAGEIFG